MTILAERLGYDRSAQHDEGNTCDQYDCRQPDQMFDVFEQVCVLAPNKSGAILAKPNDLGYRDSVSPTMIEITSRRDAGHARN